MIKNRRNFIKIITLIPTFFTSCSRYLPVPQKRKYLKNSKLKTIKNGYKGNVLHNDLFQNLYGGSGSKGLWDALKRKFSSNPQQKIKDNEKYKLKVIKNSAIFKEKRDYICWLGHASFLIQIDGKKILTDPCLTSPPFYQRLSKLPFAIDDIKPNYILISHGHYDHLDTDSIKKFDNSIALIPLKMSKLIKDINSTIQTQEAGWYQQYDINEKFEIFFMPSRHWYKRTAFDTNQILWGSFIIKTKEKTLYFAGDSGYSKHFKDIASLFNSIDIAIMPIGAYRPRNFMKSNHMNPQDSLMASKDLNAKEIIPMHFGTFDLGDEPLGEPESLFRKIGVDENIHFLDIGEKILL